MKMKKLICLLLAVITAFSMLQVTAFAETRGADDQIFFDDVSKDHWAYDAVKWAKHNGITAGIGNNLFGVDVTVKRADAVTFLWAYYGSPKPKTTTSPFSDVKKSDWYYSAVLWAYENHIVAGSNGKFSYDEICTISQIATMVYAMAGRPEIPAGTAKPYDNVNSKKYYFDALKWCCVINKLHKSIPTNQFSQTRVFEDVPCTRAALVTLLYNYNYRYSSKINLKTAVESMVQCAEREESRTDRTKYGSESGKAWCAAFVSWCAMRTGLADAKGVKFNDQNYCEKVWSALTPSANYAFPVLRTKWCTNIGQQFNYRGQLFVTQDYFRTDLRKTQWGGASLVKDCDFIPRRGDIVIFYSDCCTCCNSNDITHVGIVQDVTPNNDANGTYTIKTIEGNTGYPSQVAIREYKTVNLATGETGSNSNNVKYMAAFGRIR